MYDAIVSGAGPAGSLAALQLRRAGARVLLIDRASFPRSKLCGDTLNPGAMALLHAAQLSARVAPAGVPIDGMLVSGANGVQVRGLYGAGTTGLAIRRDTLDGALLTAALEAGADLLDATAVVGPALQAQHDDRVRGVRVRTPGGTRTIEAPVTIAADGRRSPLAFALGLARHPRWPRRWAIGGYFSGVTGAGRLGEMHVRPGRYLGVSPTIDGLTNICLVTADRRGLEQPAALLASALRVDPLLRDRCAEARRESDVVSLGPLAVDVARPGAPGLLLAGDAAGFVDPMTGDGLHLALRGGMLAADVAVDLLEGRVRDGAGELARRRRRAFSFKLRFNRALRTLVASPMGVRVGAAGARVLPIVLRRVIALAGDVDRRPGVAA